MVGAEPKRERRSGLVLNIGRCDMEANQYGRGDRYVGMAQYPASVGLPTHGREAKEHPCGVPNRTGQLRIARKLGFEASEGFGAVVVLEEKGHPSAMVVPDGKPIGSDDNAPRLCAAPGRWNRSTTWRS